MDKSFSKQLGSTLAHIQDLFDTVLHRLFKSGLNNKKNTVISNIIDVGDAYYETYANIKKGKDKT